MTRAAEVYEAFQATNEKKSSATSSRGAELQRWCAWNFNADINQFLEDAFGYSKYHLWDKKPECSCVQKGIVHRVRPNPETHRWTADPHLDLGFLAWLERRANGTRRPDELLMQGPSALALSNAKACDLYQPRQLHCSLSHRL